MKNKKQTSKKTLPYLDYFCSIGERVQWKNMKDEKFEGIIIEWKEDNVAVVKLDDGTTKEIKC